MPETRVQEAVDRYRRDFSARGMYLYSVYPNIRSILRMLHEAGVHVGLATSKPLRLARDILSYFALDGDFDRIVGEEDAAAKLGKAELIRRALPDRYRRAAMVGDRKFDMAGALANGIEGIGAGYGCGTEEELTVAGASVVVPDTEGLRAVLCPGGEIPRGFFLTVEGPDGSGKTTQTELLEKRLRQFGFSVLRTREPGGCAIRPAVERGMLVLCDRFVDSSVAYQGGGRGLGVETVQQINDPAVDGMTPDATLYLAIDHREALRRRLSASEPDRLELEAGEFHERVQKAYERLVRDNRRRFVVVDAARGVDEVARDALDAVLERLLPDRRA